MAKTEWGKKHACTACDAKFYDMGLDPAVCPSCGTEVVKRSLLKPRRAAAAKPTPKVEPANDKIEEAEFPEEIEDVQLEDSEVEMDDADDDDLIVDEEMDEDVTGVAEHIDTNNEKD